MRTRLDTDLEAIQREAQLRRIGRDFHDLAAAISSDTVDAVAAVVTRLASTTDYGELVSQGFGEAMVVDAETRHLRTHLDPTRTPMDHESTGVQLAD